jgi:hypothetical protein
VHSNTADELALTREIKALQSEVAKTQADFITGKMGNVLLAAQDERIHRETKHSQMHEQRVLNVDDQVREGFSHVKSQGGHRAAVVS